MRILLVIAFFIFLSSSAYAELQSSPSSYQYTPTPRADIYDLDHSKYYTWGINLKNDLVDLSKVEITSASISFANIRNWDNGAYALWVRLLDNAVLGVTSFNDPSNNLEDDALGGQGELLHRYSSGDLITLPDGSINPDRIPNPYPWKSYRGRDITYKFTDEQIDLLNEYALNDGIIGLGFDPDCHFYNDGVSFSITVADKTSEVPEPATMLLFGTGLAGLAGFRMRKKKR